MFQRNVVASRWLFVLFFGMITSVCYGQEEEAAEEEPRFVLSFNPSYTYVPLGSDVDNIDDKGHFVPAIGLDFFYRIHPRWEVGTIIDFELAEYLIPRRNDLRRERALILTAMVAYQLSARWNLIMGGGIELEKHKNLGVVRLGGEHVIPLKNEWFIPLGAFVDYKEEYDTWSLSIGIGKEF